MAGFSVRAQGIPSLKRQKRRPADMINIFNVRASAPVMYGPLLIKIIQQAQAMYIQAEAVTCSVGIFNGVLGWPSSSIICKVYNGRLETEG